MTTPPTLLDTDFGAWTPAVAALADALAATAAERDRAGGSALAQRRLIRESGLLALAIPTTHGGAGAPWPLVFRATRRLAAADSSMGHLFGFQHLQISTLLLFAAPDQRDPWLAATARERWFWGNAVNSRDARLVARRVDGGWRLDGVKGFCSGSKDADALVVSFERGPGEADRLYAVLPGHRAGLRVNDDWDNLGQRQTDSGTVTFDGVAVADAEVLGPPGPNSSPRATLRQLIAQSVLAEIYLGNAMGALDAALDHTRRHARPWPMAQVDRAVDDPMLQRRSGELWALLRAARAQNEAAAAHFQQAWDAGDALTPAARGDLAMDVAAARVNAGRVALDVTSQVFDLMGARATTARLAFDRYWRNVRVHTLHDPLDYRALDIGRWLLTGDTPSPSAYG